MEDLTVRRLTKKVFPYIWLHHKLMSSIPSTGIFPFSEMTIFSQTIGNAVIVYLHMYRPTLSHYLEKHGPSMPQSKMHFWIHVAFLCLQVRLVNDNVFDYFLTVCSITAEVALHCYMQGYDEVLSLASLYFCAFFETELYEGFHKTGGWIGLFRYIKYTSCPELYELVNGYIKKTTSPNEHLPILIMIKCEHLAAQRREKLMALRLFRIGEIERDDQAKLLVSGIFHWDFMENQRISELRPGVLKRMDNVRHKKGKSNITTSEEMSGQSSEVNEKLNNDSKIRHGDDFIILFDEAQPLEIVATTLETRSKDIQTLEDIKFMEVKNENKNELSITSEKVESSSTSSLRELCDFYESLSSQSYAAFDNSKSFKSGEGKCKDPKFSESNGISTKYENVDKFERYPRFVHYVSENNKTFNTNEKFTTKTVTEESYRTLPKSTKFTSKTVVKGNAGTFQIGTNFTPENLIQSTGSLHVDVLSEITKSFQELGLSCLFLVKTHQDDKSVGDANFAKIMENCRRFQSKYSSIQFAILIPKDYFNGKTINASEKVNSNDINSETHYNIQQLPRIIQDFENDIVPPKKLYSETKRSRFLITKVDDDQLMMCNETQLLQYLSFQMVQKSGFLDSNIEEKDLILKGGTSTTSKISDKKVKDSQMLSKIETSLLEKICTIDSISESRFETAKVTENQPNDLMILWNKSRTSEVTKIFENKLQENLLVNEGTETSRFIETKVNENKAKNTTSILEENMKNKAIKISRFTVTKVNENNSSDTSILFDKIMDENKSKDPTSILRKIWINEKIGPSKISVDNQLMESIGTSFVIKSSPTSRFSATKVDGGRKSRLSSRNYSITEISDEAEKVQYQDNGCVRYHKRVNFAEHPFISNYQPYSSDESPNSRTSRENVNKNSLDDS